MRWLNFILQLSPALLIDNIDKINSPMLLFVLVILNESCFNVISKNNHQAIFYVAINFSESSNTFTKHNLTIG